MAESKKRKKERLERLEKDVDALNPAATGAGQEIERIRREITELREELHERPTAWQRTQLARHPQRPYTLDYVRILFEGFSEIHGDRSFGDDAAIVCGMARFHGQPVMVIGHQKGRDTRENLTRNWGMPKPEGYRKALRVMELAAKYKRPIVTFVDTMGAYPGVDAEERGQAEAIARNLREMARLPVPVVVNITGEGGSGGALAIAVGLTPQLRPAIALNSAGFNLARTVGPVVGQILLGLVGVFLLFALNAGTYIRVTFAMPSWKRSAEARASQRREGFAEAARTGIAFVRNSGELKAVFDPRGGQWAQGRYVPSLLAAIGEVIERHLVALGFMSPREGDEATPEEKAVAVAAEGAPARFCPRCSSPSFLKLEGCDTCVSCGYSRCG